MKRKIRYASLQSAINAPGVFGGEITLDTRNKHKDAEMYLEPGILIAVHKGEEVIIPLTNVKCAVVDNDLSEISKGVNKKAI